MDQEEEVGGGLEGGREGERECITRDLYAYNHIIIIIT